MLIKTWAQGIVGFRKRKKRVGQGIARVKKKQNTF